MKYISPIYKVGGSRLVRILPSLFTDVEYVMIDVKSIRNDTAFTARIIPYRGQVKKVSEKELTITLKELAANGNNTKSRSSR